MTSPCGAAGRRDGPGRKGEKGNSNPFFQVLPVGPQMTPLMAPEVLTPWRATVEGAEGTLFKSESPPPEHSAQLGVGGHAETGIQGQPGGGGGGGGVTEPLPESVCGGQ